MRLAPALTPPAESGRGRSCTSTLVVHRDARRVNETWCSTWLESGPMADYTIHGRAESFCVELPAVVQFKARGYFAHVSWGPRGSVQPLGHLRASTP